MSTLHGGASSSGINDNDSLLPTTAAGTLDTSTASILKAVKLLFTTHFRHFDEKIWDELYPKMTHEEHKSLIGELLITLHDRKKTSQAKADAAQFRIWKYFGTSIVNVKPSPKGKGNKIGGGSSDRARSQDSSGKGRGGKAGSGNSSGKGGKAPRVALQHATLDPSSLKMFQLDQDSSTEIASTVSLEVAKRDDSGLVLASRNQAIDLITEKFKSKSHFALLVEAEKGEQHFGSERIHSERNIQQVALLLAASDTTTARSRLAWLINFGAQNYIFRTGQQVIKTPQSSELSEITLRIMKQYTCEAWYDELLESPVKMANLSLKNVLPPELYAQIEPVAKAHQMMPKKGMPQLDLIQAYFRAPTANVLDIFRLSYYAGHVFSMGGAHRDQDFGTVLVSLPASLHEDDGDLDNLGRTLKDALGPAFLGVVPTSKDWSRFGCRIPAEAAQYADARMRLANVTGEPAPEIPIVKRYLLEHVPKGLPRKDVVATIKLALSWVIEVLHEMTGPRYQTPTTTTYLVGAANDPSQFILETDQGFITIIEYSTQQKPRKEVPDWAKPKPTPPPTPRGGGNESVDEAMNALAVRLNGVDVDDKAAPVDDTATNPKAKFASLAKKHGKGAQPAKSGFATPKNTIVKPRQQSGGRGGAPVVSFREDFPPVPSSEEEAVSSSSILPVPPGNLAAIEELRQRNFELERRVALIETGLASNSKKVDDLSSRVDSRHNETMQEIRSFAKSQRRLQDSIDAIAAAVGQPPAKQPREDKTMDDS